MNTSVQLPSINGVPIITYGLIGITTLVLAYITFQDQTVENEVVPEKEETTNNTIQNLLSPSEEKPVEESRSDFIESVKENSPEVDRNLSLFSPETPIRAEQPRQGPFPGGKNKKNKSKKNKQSKKNKKSKTKRNTK